MGNVIDLQTERMARSGGIDRDWTLADRLAMAWYSPAGRLLGCALVFTTVMIGLAILVFGMAAILGRF